jgi:hypothetical protein
LTLVLEVVVAMLSLAVVAAANPLAKPLVFALVPQQLPLVD